MSLDRTKVLEAAQKHLAKGNYDKAIVEYRKLVEADPSDIRTWLKIGDLYTRNGARREAIDTYARVAATYGSSGFSRKAVAVYKQILKLDPTRLDIQLELGRQYELLELTSEALSTYEHVAAGYARAGDIDRALTTLAKMTELEPENIPVRIKLAEALSKAGRTGEAAEAFETGAALLKAQGRMDDFIKVAERLQFHRPEDAKLSRELAGLYLERRDPKRALSKLQLCFKADPKDVGTLELLAEAFNQLGQLPKTLSVYREVARIHQEANRPDERARTLKKMLELDPGDAEARQALASYASGASVRRDIAPPASAVVEPSRSAVRTSEPAPELEESEELDELDDDELEGDEDIDVLEEEILVEEDVPEVAAAPASSAPSSESRSVPPDVQREAQIARLLTECDVFMRYGLKQKVMEQLRAVLEIEPLHVEARERLKDLYLGQGQTVKAMAELMTLAEILREEESAAAILYLREVLELDPTNAEALARLSAMDGSVAPPEPESAAEDDVLFLDESTGLVESTHAGPYPEEGGVGTEAPLEQSSESPVTATDAPSLDALDEAHAAGPAQRPAMVPPPSASQSLGMPRVPRPMDLLAPMSPREFDDVPLRPSSPGQLAADVARRSVAPGEVEEILDEADFFVAQGLFDEARASLGDALSHHPGHPLIEEKLREVGALANAAAPQLRSEPPRSAQPVADQSFELAEKLAEELEDDIEGDPGGDVLDVEEVFAQFKKGVEQQVGMEDSETHFDLGIAYKEMGLLDDAINEFRLCVRNPLRVCIAETMIGLCHIEKGDVAEAIAHFKKGLYADTKTDREELGLYFELGNAYDLLHDPKEAIYYFQKVQKRDPTFRGVGARIQALATPQAPAAAAAPMAPDDIDRAFDDLMGED